MRARLHVCMCECCSLCVCAEGVRALGCTSWCACDVRVSEFGTHRPRDVCVPKPRAVRVRAAVAGCARGLR